MQTERLSTASGKEDFDGKDYEVTGDPNSDVRSYTKMNDRTLSMTVKKGGEVVVYGLIIVSADGKSQEVRLTSPDAVTVTFTMQKRSGKKMDGGTQPFTKKNNPLGPRFA